jgi:hypothetical protein
MPGISLTYLCTKGTVISEPRNLFNLKVLAFFVELHADLVA